MNNNIKELEKRNPDYQKETYNKIYEIPDLIKIDGLSLKKCKKFTEFYRKYSEHDKFYIEVIKNKIAEKKGSISILEVGCSSGVLAKQ